DRFTAMILVKSFHLSLQELKVCGCSYKIPFTPMRFYFFCIIVTEGVHHWYPDCSSDGQWILYTKFTNNYSNDFHNIFAYNTVNSETAPIFPDLQTEYHYCASFSPDGSKFCYLLKIADGYELFVADFAYFGPHLTLTSPEGGDVFFEGSNYQISWTSLEVENINIEFSDNGGTSWSTIAENVPSSNNTYNWTAPSLTSSDCYIKIKDASDSSISDKNDEPFSIIPTAVFSPTLLKLSVDPQIQYDFDGTDLQIPVNVSGTDATLYFLVYTKGIASTVPDMRNGYLGWHHVCKIDTCVYLSPQYQFSPGSNTVTWTGLDDDDNAVPEGEYTYYMWAYDSVNPKQKMSHFQSRFGMRRTWFQTVDEQGIPLNNPWYCQLVNPTSRWEIGSNPLDETAQVVTRLHEILPEGFRVPHTGIGVNHPTDLDYFYIRLGNPQTEVGAILKYKFVPNGDAALDLSFGDNGYGMVISAPHRYEPGVVTDGTYLYSGDQNQKVSMEPDAEMYIVNYDGSINQEIDLRPWWTRPDEVALGKLMNSGPDVMRERNGKIALNCYCSCIKQMVDPARYLESGEYEDLFLWSNLNGDYVLDQNFEETSITPWACNYGASGVGTPGGGVSNFQYTIDIDDNFFTFCSSYDYSPLSFGLLGPDGTGIGMLSFQGDTGGWKMGSIFLDSDSPYDGIYCDNDQAGGPHWEWQPNEYTSGIYWVGHDSINGIIANFSIEAKIEKIIEKITSYQTLNKGLKNSLTSKLEKVLSKLDKGNYTAAVNQMGAFINQVEAKRDKKKGLTEEQADELIALAQNIINSMGSTAKRALSQEENALPLTFKLSQNSPNPFNPLTTIEYSIPTGTSMRARLDVYDLRGALIKTLVDEIRSPGVHSVVWDGTDDSGNNVSSGVYIYRIKVGSNFDTKKMTLIR
ncbi:MAG: hypothetical protein HOC71_13995, partial [Candidatus Latescibacteria bacterium]|nr:hypothetical protein [Candidatus Latescibacterota bacterium]